MNIIDDRYGKTQAALFGVAIFLFVCNIKFWMKLLVPDKRRDGRNNALYSQIKESFMDNTYRHCNPIDRLRSTVNLYRNFDLFNMKDDGKT